MKAKVNLIFWLGFIACFSLISMYQDMMGQEAYAEHIKNNWWQTSPLFWLVILLVALGAKIYHTRVICKE